MFETFGETTKNMQLHTFHNIKKSEKPYSLFLNYSWKTEKKVRFDPQWSPWRLTLSAFGFDDCSFSC